MKTPKRLPSPREYASLAWDARLEVLAALNSIRLAYLKTERCDMSSTRQDVSSTRQDVSSTRQEDV